MFFKDIVREIHESITKGPPTHTHSHTTAKGQAI